MWQTHAHVVCCLISPSPTVAISGQSSYRKQTFVNCYGRTFTGQMADALPVGWSTASKTPKETWTSESWQSEMWHPAIMTERYEWDRDADGYKTNKTHQTHLGQPGLSQRNSLPPLLQMRQYLYNTMTTTHWNITDKHHTKKLEKVKKSSALNERPSQTNRLSVVTCHIRSHSVTFHPTQVNTSQRPNLNTSQRPVLDLHTTERRKAELT